MSRVYGPVWVIAEQINGQLLPVSLQLIGHARKLADGLGSTLEVVLLGEQISALFPQLVAAGADRVYAGDSSAFCAYHPQVFTTTIVGIAQKHKPEIVLLGSTFTGRELAPLLAAKLGTGLTTHSIELVLDENMNLVQKIPAYGGLMSVICPEHRPQMATVARGVFPLPEMDRNREGEITMIAPPDRISSRVEILEIAREEPKGVDLESAHTVVAGGAGACDSAGWKQITELAQVLNAGLGSTRPAVDAGWTGIGTMIGQSGKMVKPELYIGVGLSGEQQHMVGIIGAKVMIAINNDPKSPVFNRVDLGIVADCREFIPVFIDKLKKYRRMG
jgi:electron transfer flavoprotein alpha subunit